MIYNPKQARYWNLWVAVDIEKFFWCLNCNFKSSKACKGEELFLSTRKIFISSENKFIAISKAMPQFTNCQISFSSLIFTNNSHRSKLSNAVDLTFLYNIFFASYIPHIHVYTFTFVMSTIFFQPCAHVHLVSLKCLKLCIDLSEWIYDESVFLVSTNDIDNNNGRPRKRL